MSMLIGRDVAAVVARAARDRGATCPGCAALAARIDELEAAALDTERRRWLDEDPRVRIERSA